jgi:5-formyltetrahydrofolate cyclo-ligase
LTKGELRKLYLEKRVALGASEYADLNKRVCENFFVHIDLSLIKVLHLFLPLAKNKEPDTWLILNRVQREFPNIQISIPKVNQQEQRLDNFYFEGPDQLSNGQWGLQEPQNGVVTPVEKIDMVLVPLLAFDRSGHRVGYGKGFYDRFLKTCRTDCLRVGISLFSPVDSIYAINIHDIPLSNCVTPSRFFSYPQV